MLNDFLVYLDQTDVSQITWAQYMEPSQQNGTGLIDLYGNARPAWHTFRFWGDLPVERVVCTIFLTLSISPGRLASGLLCEPACVCFCGPRLAHLPLLGRPPSRARGTPGLRTWGFGLRVWGRCSGFSLQCLGTWGTIPDPEVSIAVGMMSGSAAGKAHPGRHHQPACQGLGAVSASMVCELACICS